MEISKETIASIVLAVVEQVEKGRTSSVPASTPVGKYLGSCASVGEAVDKARRAFEAFGSVSVKTRGQIIAAIRQIALDNLETIARMAHEETGLGRYEDKLAKNRLVIEKTPGVEDLQPVAWSGDEGLTLAENAPYGVIGAITPTTNPTETILCNAIGMIAGGNAVVFNPHPRAKNSCAFTVHLINTAIQSCGGPQDLVTIMANPTMESSQELMRHPKTRILVVTGGGGIVKEAFKAGKKVIAAGPGNPPAIVDETADLDEAAKSIILGATLDNNILCIAEKEIFVVDSVADDFIAALKRHGGFQVIGSNIAKLEKLIFPDGHINADLIGKNADFILSQIGLKVEPSVRMGFIDVPFEHFLVKTEQMMPILPLVRCKDVAAAIDWAIEAEQGYFHTATMHSRNLDALHEMAVRCNCSIFVKNGPSCAGLGYGGEGFATMSISSPTGEGLTSARTFTRSRRCTLKGHFRIV